MTTPRPVGHQRWATYPAYRDLPIQRYDAADPYHAAAVRAIHSGRPVPVPQTAAQHAAYVDLWHPWSDPARTGWTPRQDRIAITAEPTEAVEVLDEREQERFVRTLAEDEMFAAAVKAVLLA